MEFGKWAPGKRKGTAERRRRWKWVDTVHRLNDALPSGTGGNQHARIRRCENERRSQSGRRLREAGKEKNIAAASAYLQNFYNCPS